MLTLPRAPPPPARPSSGSLPPTSPCPSSYSLCWAVTVVRLSVLGILGAGEGSAFSLEPCAQHRVGSAGNCAWSKHTYRYSYVPGAWTPRITPGTGRQGGGRCDHQVSGHTLGPAVLAPAVVTEATQLGRAEPEKALWSQRAWSQPLGLSLKLFVSPQGSSPSHWPGPPQK